MRSNGLNRLWVAKLIDFRALLPLKVVRSCCILIFEKYNSGPSMATFRFARWNTFRKELFLTILGCLQLFNLLWYPTNVENMSRFQIDLNQVPDLKKDQNWFSSSGFFRAIKNLRVVQNTERHFNWVKTVGGVVIAKLLTGRIYQMLLEANAWTEKDQNANFESWLFFGQ